VTSSWAWFYPYPIPNLNIRGFIKVAKFCLETAQIPADLTIGGENSSIPHNMAGKDDIGKKVPDGTNALN